MDAVRFFPPLGAQVSAHKARGIIVLHEGGDDEESGDAKMLRAVLALTSIREGQRAKADKYKEGADKGEDAMGHIVVEARFCRLHHTKLAPCAEHCSGTAAAAVQHYSTAAAQKHRSNSVALQQ